MPINGIEWSDEAVDWFKTMTHNRTFYARLYPQKPTVTVELFLEKGKMGAMRYINKTVLHKSSVNNLWHLQEISFLVQ